MLMGSHHRVLTQLQSLLLFSAQEKDQVRSLEFDRRAFDRHSKHALVVLTTDYPFYGHF